MRRNQGFGSQASESCCATIGLPFKEKQVTTVLLWIMQGDLKLFSHNNWAIINLFVYLFSITVEFHHNPKKKNPPMLSVLIKYL